MVSPKTLNPQVDLGELNVLLSDMSPLLRAEVVKGTNAWLQKIPFFTACPGPVIFRLAAHMQQSTYPPQEVIFAAGDWGHKLFVVRRGLVASRGRLFDAGKIMCEDCLFREMRLTNEGRAVTYSQVVSFERAHIIDAMKDHPEVMHRFRLAGIKHVFREEARPRPRRASPPPPHARRRRGAELLAGAAHAGAGLHQGDAGAAAGAGFLAR